MMTIQLPSPPQPLRRSARLSLKTSSSKQASTALRITTTTTLLTRNPANTDDERRSLSPTPLLFNRKKRCRNPSGRLSPKKRKLSADRDVDINQHLTTTSNDDDDCRPEGVSGPFQHLQEGQVPSSALPAEPLAAPPAESPESHEATLPSHDLIPTQPHLSNDDTLGLTAQPNSVEPDFVPAWNNPVLDDPNFQSVPAVPDSGEIYPTPVNDQLAAAQATPFVTLAPLPSASFPPTSSSLCHALSYADPSQGSPPLLRSTSQEMPDRYLLARQTLCLARRALWAVITKTPWAPSSADELATPLDPGRMSMAADRNQMFIPITEDAINAAKEAERGARLRQQRELKSLRQYCASLPAPSVAGWKRSPAEIRDAPIWKALCCAKVGEIVESMKPQTIRSMMEKQCQEYQTMNKPDNWYLRCVPPGELPLQDGAIVPSFDVHSHIDIVMDHEEGDIHNFEFYPFELDSDEDADADGETVTEESDCEESVRDENMLCPGEERLDFGDIIPSTIFNVSSATPTPTKKQIPTLSSIPLPSIPLSTFHMLLFAFSSGEASEIVRQGTPVDFTRKNDWWMAGHQPSTSMLVDSLPFAPQWNSQPAEPGPIDWDNFLAVVGANDQTSPSTESNGDDMGYSLG